MNGVTDQEVYVMSLAEFTFIEFAMMFGKIVAIVCACIIAIELLVRAIIKFLRWLEQK